jgi:hypothetical protein
MSFDFTNVAAVEFGVVRGSLLDPNYSFVPVDTDVQAALQEMVRDTLISVGVDSRVPIGRYEPAP